MDCPPDMLVSLDKLNLLLKDSLGSPREPRNRSSSSVTLDVSSLGRTEDLDGSEDLELSSSNRVRLGVTLGVSR